MAIIVLDTDFECGKLIKHKANKSDDNENFFIVIGYGTIAIDESGQVSTYVIDATDQFGKIHCFRPIEIQLVEALI